MRKITDQEIQKIANQFGYEYAAIKAVMDVESLGGGYTASGKMKILFERHKFYKYSGSVPASKIRPDLSNSTPGGYKGGDAEWDRLIDAIKIMEKHGQSAEPAYWSASYGLGQIMGFHFKRLGFNSAKEMVDNFAASEANQLIGMMNFISTDTNLDRAMKNKDWSTFAYYYNGRDYKKNGYDTKLADSYKKFA